MAVNKYQLGLAAVLLFILLILGFHFLFWDDYGLTWGSNSTDTPYFYHKNGVRRRTGSVWPMPQSMVPQDEVYILKPGLFDIMYTRSSHRCQDIDDAISRYKKIIFGDNTEGSTNSKGRSELRVLYVHVSEPCEKQPSLNSSETYVLVVKRIGMLTSETQWGLMRGLETFSQLLYLNDADEIELNGVAVEDFPRFHHRGVLMDTARHYIPVEIIKQNIELMSYNKMSVLHWHITDHESFPIKFEKFPEIPEAGAFHPKAIYTEQDVKDIVEFARKRGIRIIPEIDFPGHSWALSKSKPHLFIKCQVSGTGGNVNYDVTLNPLSPEVFIFIREIYTELRRLFLDEYIHLGADEVSHRCWNGDHGFSKFVQATKVTPEEVHRLFTEGMLQEARKIGFKPVTWNDAFNHGYTKTPATVHVWTGGVMGRPYQIAEDLADGGTDVIVSYPWYIDNHTKRSWKEMYLSDVARYYESHILGGEACAWGEHVDSSNIFTEYWPLASTVAERLWSSSKVASVDWAEERLKNFECIMKNRGAKISAISPGHCETDWEAMNL